MSFPGFSLQLSASNGSAYARNNLRHFNINHVIKIPYYTQGKKLLQNIIKYLIDKYPLISPYIIHTYLF